MQSGASWLFAGERFAEIGDFAAIERREAGSIEADGWLQVVDESHEKSRA